MVGAYTNPLEASLDKLAVDTWNRLRDIKAFSRRPEPFNSVRLGETTITDLAMLDLCRQGLTRSIFLQTPQHRESFWGTDFEWWLGSAGTGWLRLAVQAKKLDMKTSRYLSLAHRPNGVLQINTLEHYASRNRATPLYCLYNYSGEVYESRHWHCCQRPFRAEELGCSVTQPSRVREAIHRHGMRTFDFLHRWSGTVPWRCLASCPGVREAFGLGSANPSTASFPLIDRESYYRELPPFRSQPQFRQVPLSDRGAEVGDAMLGYSIEIAEFDDSMAEYYDLDVGIPRAINVTDPQL